MRPQMYPATALLLLCAPSLVAQSKPSAAIPSTAPTQSVSDLPSAHPNAVTSDLISESKVTWNGSQLTIEAAGEPMPELLGRVAHATGMKITGGVPDERVYGKYGPASVQTVFGQLFDGLAINMMLVNDSPTRPKELLLTVRSGAPTPPSTRQVVNSDMAARPEQPIPPIHTSPAAPQQQRPSTPSTQPALPPLAPPPADNTAFTNNGNAVPSSNNGTSTTNADSTDSSQPQSPNGIKTPEQIFEELRKRQQQQNTQ